jgi:hypothetical protein
MQRAGCIGKPIDSPPGAPGGQQQSTIKDHRSEMFYRVVCQLTVVR